MPKIHFNCILDERWLEKYDFVSNYSFLAFLEHKAIIFSGFDIFGELNCIRHLTKHKFFFF